MDLKRKRTMRESSADRDGKDLEARDMGSPSRGKQKSPSSPFSSPSSPDSHLYKDKKDAGHDPLDNRFHAESRPSRPSFMIHDILRSSSPPRPRHPLHQLHHSAILPGIPPPLQNAFPPHVPLPFREVHEGTFMPSEKRKSIKPADDEDLQNSDYEDGGK